jgi:RHS repeat-associated protein
VKKTEGGQTILYINQYYEKNLTTGVVTTSYYLGGQLVANRVGTTLSYIHQDSLSSTSVMSTSTGTLDSSMTFYPFGDCRFSQGTLGTDKKFTGQQLDGTGLYYYNARYYDPTVGRFISADTVGIKQNNPQTLNRYTYCFNNPLTFNDPTGQWPDFIGIYKAVVNKVDQTVDSIITHAENAVGIDSISSMNTPLAQDVSVMNVRKDSLIDKALSFTDTDVTIYPIGVFSKQPMDTRTQYEEGYHWNDQKNSKSTVVWYADYIEQYGMNLALYGGE